MLTLSATTPAAPPGADRTEALSRPAANDAPSQEPVVASTVVSLQGTSAGVASGLSGVASVGVTSGSLPAALCRMRDIAVAAGTGTLDDASRARLHAEYSQLSRQVTQAVTTAVREHAQADATAAQAVPRTEGAGSHQSGHAQDPGHSQDSGHARDPGHSKNPGGHDGSGSGSPGHGAKPGGTNLPGFASPARAGAVAAHAGGATAASAPVASASAASAPAASQPAGSEPAAVSLSAIRPPAVAQYRQAAPAPQPAVSVIA